MKLRIESDGTVHGTLLLTEEGHRIEGIRHIRWEADAEGASCAATITLTRVRLDAMIEKENVVLHDSGAAI